MSREIPMTDIVERLRIARPISAQIAMGSNILLEAAEEIERLRFELNAKTNEVEIADNEIERLKGANRCSSPAKR